ncbi:MAG: CHAD domain-containing protein [Gammaproteobacteria bacterium]|nr:CHAD domain-containing protein [Gammaproteobacteria bacterium]
MTPSQTHGFLLPHDLDVVRLVQLLGGERDCRMEDVADFSLQFFDSFDWRLAGADLRLFQLETPHGKLLRLKQGGDGEVLESVEFDGLPVWPADLPPGALRDRVGELLEMRVLLPLVTVRGSATDLCLLNDDGKTVVRLQLLRLSSESSEVSEPRSLWPRLRILPVKGYADDADALIARLSDEHEWPQAPGCLFEESLAAVGREPGDYSSKLTLSIRPRRMAVDAMRRILLTLLDTIERNVEGTRANLDSEFLHDLRVATRRTRSALGQVKRVLPDAMVADFKERFAWLGQVTGPTRDLDVFLLELPLYRASLPVAMRADLDPLQQLIERDHKREQEKLAAELDGERFRSLLADWRALLEADEFPGEPGWFADLPIERVASRRIWRVYKRVLSDGRAAVAHGEPEAMHELRKDCKKLRYLIEFFRGLYPAEDLKGVVRTLKKLLDNLGEFQDKEVQAEHLRLLAAEFDPTQPGYRSALLAIGALVADSLRAQEAAHARFADRFAAFDSAENRARYKALFKTQHESTS